MSNEEYPINENVILKRINEKWIVDVNGNILPAEKVLDLNANEEVCFKIREVINSIDGPQSNLSECEVVPPQKWKSGGAKALAKKQETKAIAQYNYTSSQIQAIKNTVAKGATDSEFEMLMYLADRYQLDPILKEIFYAPKLQTIMTSRDGYLKVAQRDPGFEGIQSMAVCENDDFELDVPNHSVKHKFGKGDRGEVLGAWAIVYKKGIHPFVAYAPYKEHVQQGSSAWKYKSAMCCKCAESFALKRVYGINGLVTHEEMGFENVEILDAEYQEVSQEAL